MAPVARLERLQEQASLLAGPDTSPGPAGLYAPRRNDAAQLTPCCPVPSPLLPAATREARCANRLAAAAATAPKVRARSPASARGRSPRGRRVRETDRAHPPRG